MSGPKGLKVRHKPCRPMQMIPDLQALLSQGEHMCCESVMF